MKVTKVVKCRSPHLTSLLSYLPTYPLICLSFLYVFLFIILFFCHIIMMVSIHVGHNHKMSKLRLEPSPPWPQSKALTIQPPFHVMKNNVIIKNINSYIF